MTMKLISEDQLLDPTFRAAVLNEIRGPENKNRKNAELRKQEIYKDKIKKWVVESLIKEGLEGDTLTLMETRASNINLAKKVVNKLSQTYVDGVTRDAEVEADQEKVDLLVDEMDFNSRMKKTDRYVQLARNTMTGVVPQLDTRESDESSKKFDVKLQNLFPHQYDVIEDIVDRERARVVILSEFVDRNEFAKMPIVPDSDGRVSTGVIPQFDQGDSIDQTIADHPDDQGRTDKIQTFIWWSDKYHFTTDQNGAVIDKLSPDDMLNPIEKLPWINFAEQQDGSFWAEGGSDLIEGTILFNKVMTDMFSIAYQQGYGQMVITGKDIPKNLTTGPHRALHLNQEDAQDPQPTVTFASASPPLGDWMAMAEQLVALILSSNNLSPRNMSTSVSAADFPSGIAMLIENSQSTADEQERQRLFRDNEPWLWEITKRWLDVLSQGGNLTERFAKIGTLQSGDVRVHFETPKAVITEKEEIEILKLRKDLGLDRMIDLLMRDKGLTEQEAKERLVEIQMEKIERMRNMTGPRPVPAPGEQNAEQENETEAAEAPAIPEAEREAVIG